PQFAALQGGDSKNIFVTDASKDIPDTLLGRPIVFSEYAKTLGDKGDLILGSWAEFWEAERSSLTGANSMHIRFLENEQCIRFVRRNDGKCVWRAALTPVNGATLSPFVTLQARA
ncbi:unnamed protein product, partial [marine sediment metagenome]